MNSVITTRQACSLSYIAVTCVFVCVLFVWIAYHMFDLGSHGVTAQLIIGSLFVIISVWTIWVVRTLYHIVSWWTDILQRVDTAQTLLEQTHQDIKEIKSIRHELSSR